LLAALLGLRLRLTLRFLLVSLSEPIAASSISRSAFSCSDSLRLISTRFADIKASSAESVALGLGAASKPWAGRAAIWLSPGIARGI
jgi:hypothetical protein